MSSGMIPKRTVARRLFPPTEDDNIHIDNFNNSQRELADAELEKKATKWHYNFIEDCPLPGDGNVKWMDYQNGRRIGEVHQQDEAENDAGTSQNENTINENSLEINEVVSGNNENNSNEVTSSNGGNETFIEETVNVVGYTTPIKTDAPPRKRIKE